MIPEIIFEFPEVPQINFLIDLQGESLYQKWLQLGLGTGDYTAFLEWLKVKGDKGASAYDVAVELGFVGTQAEWVASLKGEKGEKGDQGDKGDDFTYEDFTPEQIEGLKVKGDPFLYSDFTPAQIAELQRPATEAVTAVNEAEALRVTAEATRVENEQGRDTAEGLRVSAEADRQDNEIARENSEDDREDAEALRLSAEITRGQNEQARITAESTRQTNTATAITNANEKAGLAATATTQANTAANNANEKAGLADTAATNANNVANTYAAELALKELKANKQNSLTVDGTGTKFPTVDAVNAGLAALPNTLIAEYVHTSNLEISGFTVDTATGVFTKVGHGLENNDMLFPTLNSNNVQFVLVAYSTLKEFIFQNFMNVKSERYVINATANTFQLSLTSGGAAETYINLGTTDITKWHFERISNLPGFIIFNNINKSKVKVELIGKFATGISPNLRITVNTEVAGNVYLSSGSNVLQQIIIPNYGTIGTISADFVLNNNGTFARINSKLIKEKDLSSLKIDELFYKPAVGAISFLRISYYYPLNNSSIKITTL